MIHEIQHTAQQHNNNSSISEGYGMSQNPQNEWGQATFDSMNKIKLQTAIALRLKIELSPNAALL